MVAKDWFLELNSTIASLPALAASFIAFIPAPDEAPKFTSIVRNANGSLTLTWTGGGKLQSAASLKGPWTDVAGAASPLTLTPNADAQFARIVK